MTANIRTRDLGIPRFLKVAAAALAIGAGCSGTSDPEPKVGEGPSRVVEVTLPSGLVQHVEIRPGSAKRGELVEFHSTLTNATDEPIDLQSKICSLKFETELEWGRSGVMCSGYARTETLMPGDWVVQSDRLLIESPPGTYSIRVIHALDPSGFAEVMLEVVPWFYPS
jgi:hypothetical protein